MSNTGLEGTNQETIQILQLIDASFKKDIESILGAFQPQATVNQSNALKQYVFGKLTTETAKTYPIIHDWMMERLKKVEWERLAKFLVEGL